MEQMIQTEPQWAGKVSTKLTKATAEQIWPLFLDFFNLHKWFRGLATCYGIHGTNGEPGCIRYCGGGSIPSKTTSTDDDKKNRSHPAASWSEERLIAVDHAERTLSYEILDSNIGFQSYVSTVKIVQEGGDLGQPEGCVIEWSFTVDPVEGLVFDDLIKKYEVGLQSMAKRMEDHELEGLPEHKA